MIHYTGLLFIRSQELSPETNKKREHLAEQLQKYRLELIPINEAYVNYQNQQERLSETTQELVILLQELEELRQI